jgi:hypothetical protein
VAFCPKPSQRHPAHQFSHSEDGHPEVDIAKPLAATSRTRRWRTLAYSTIHG